MTSEYNVIDSERQPDLASNYLRQIVNKYNVESPFFNFTDKNSAILHEFVDPASGATCKIAPIGAFSEGEMAAIILEQSRIYVERGTMGDRFPRDNEVATEQLLAAFTGNFDPDRLLISVSKDDENGFKPIAGISVVINNSKLNVADIIYKDVQSQIPTFDALFLNDESLLSSILDDLQESDIACPTRYWCAPPEELENLGLVDEQLAKKIVALIPFAYVDYQKTMGDKISRYAVFDTHIPGIMALTSRKFGAREVARNDQVLTSRSVLDSILRYHYGGDEFGGFEGKIVIGLFTTDEFLRKADNFLCSLGINMALNSL